MGINVDVLTLPQRLRDFAKFSTEMAIAGKNSGPKDIGQQVDNFQKLASTASDLSIEYALATRGANKEGVAGLQQASRGTSMLMSDVYNVANTGVGRINNTYLNVAGDTAPKDAIAAATWLEKNPPALLQAGSEFVKTGSTAGKILDVSAVTGRILGALSRGAQDSVVVSGRSGSGRSTVIDSLREQMSAGRVPGSIKEARVIGLDVAGFRGGSSDPVQLAKNLKELFTDSYAGEQDAIVVIDDFDLLQDSIDASLITRNAIQDSGGKLRVLAFTSDTKAPFALDEKGLGRFAQHVEIPNTTLDRAQDLLDTKWSQIEADTGIATSGPDVTRATASLAESYLGGRNRDLAGLAVDVARGASGRVAADMFAKPRPVVQLETQLADVAKDIRKYTGKTSDIAKQRLTAATAKQAELNEQLTTATASWNAELPLVTRRTDAETKIRSLRAAGTADTDPALVKALGERDAAQTELTTLRGGKPGVIADTLDVDGIVRYVSEESGVPEDSISWNASEKFKNMLPTLKQDLIGQDHILEAFTGPVQVWKAGGKDPDRPVAVIAIGGPSQVGKTEGAYVLNEFLTGSRDSLDVVVGGAYTDESMRNSLVGAPSGYQNAEIGGALTEPARQRPHGVTLWDEANKTEPSLFDTTLQIGNSGEIADGMGRKVSFRDRVLILAGNWLRDEADAARLDWEKLTPTERAEWKGKLRAAMEAQGIKPEVLNRVTDFVVANSVNERMVRGVADLYLDKTKAQFARMGIEVNVEPEVLDDLVAKGNVPGQGGSLIKKVITKDIKEAITAQKIEGKIATDDIVTVRMGQVDGKPGITLDVTKL